MPPPTTRPLFALYVMWHPDCQHGRPIANRLREHFERRGYGYIDAGRGGVSVLELGDAAPARNLRLPIDWNGADFTGVVALTDANLVADAEWAGYVRDVARDAHEMGLPARFFPVAMDDRALELNVEQHALRWDQWDPPDSARALRLTTHLTHELCRVLRRRLDELRAVVRDGEDLGRYLDPVRVFLSHSKHDGDGETVARGIRDWLHAHGPLDTFFDVHDIPAGTSFTEVLGHEIGEGAVLAVHTDSYSSRDWCRWEIIEAKRRLTPMVVVDCLRDLDPRGMAYLGNVPVVRMNPDRTGRFGTVVACLMDEIFRTWLWRCRVGSDLANAPGVLFTARPPELIVLAALPSIHGESRRRVVYPEPSSPWQNRGL